MFRTSLLFVALALAGCDAFSSDPSAQGRVLDAVTGAPAELGSVGVQLLSAKPFDLDGRPITIDETEADADGRFSLRAEANGRRTYSVYVFSAGEADYPAAEASDEQFERYGLRNPLRRAYFQQEVDRTGDIGTVALVPTAMLVVQVALDRELSTGERLAVTVSDGPDEGALPYGAATFHPGDAPLRSDMLVPGDYTLTARWELVRGDAVVASGAEQVTTERHRQGELRIDVAGD